MGQVSLKEEFEVRKRKVENAPACISCLLDPAQTPSPCSRRISYGIILSGNNICGESIKLGVLVSRSMSRERLPVAYLWEDVGVPGEHIDVVLSPL